MINSDIQNARILVVDDQEANVKLLEYMLARAGYTAVTSTTDPRQVLGMHRSNRYDIILLDLNMPQVSGFEILEGLKEIETEGYLPVLVVTAEPAHKIRALEAGARDFVSKPFDRIEVLTRIRNMLEVRLLYTATREHGLRLEHYDTLTGLPNRKLFQDSLAMSLQQAHEHGSKLALLLIDLDRFKNINDTLGHAAGDEVLKQFAQRLVECVQVRDTVGRLGGDEFALILTGHDSQQDVLHVAYRLRAALQHPFALAQQELVLTVSMGIVVYPDDARDVDTLVKYADTAMYEAKEAGRDGYRFFTASMNAQAQRRLELEHALRKALEREEFELYYQPKVQISTGRIAGAEVLLRWHRAGHGLVSPAEFVPVLEETGLIAPVGAWVIDTACRQLDAWARRRVHPVHIAVNVSSRQFVNGDLEEAIDAALRDRAVEPGLLQLEMTESSLMENAEHAVTVLQNLRARGVGVAIDDFGTGYSSLAYLKRFPIDTLKIDIAFVRDITVNPDDAAIALAIIGMAHSLKMDVVAEGVETAAQLAYLSRNGCDYIQGYYFSKPVPVAEFERMLLEDKSLPVLPGRAEPPRTLLIVDGEDSVLGALTRLLRRDGYRILTATSASEGFEQLAMHEVQVILCDQRMPGMTGTEFLSKVKDMYPDTFRIVLSGYTDLEAILEAINRGALYRFYTKPWDNDVLRENLRAAFRHYWQLHGMVISEQDEEPAREDETLE
jgi:diguanylate cyclase (GGDEF)-like protein